MTAEPWDPISAIDDHRSPRLLRKPGFEATNPAEKRYVLQAHLMHMDRRIVVPALHGMSGYKDRPINTLQLCAKGFDLL